MNRPTTDQAFLFPSGGAELVGIVTAPKPAEDGREPASLGVLIVVGGPQYRVGSHRQFVLLARALAARGFAVMRFDCAGMGDSSGAEAAFTDRQADLRAAIDRFMQAVPGLREIAIWGLCDAASAALLYAPDDDRVSHLVLLNPWVRSEAGLARTHLKHYYLSRLREPAFWAKLFGGRLGIGRALAGLASTWRRSRAAAAGAGGELAFQARMARGWKRFRGDILLILSGDDLTAREFIDHAGDDAEWQGLLDQTRVARCGFAEADHTFSRAEWRDQVAAWTADWLSQRTLAPAPRDGRAAREIA